MNPKHWEQLAENHATWCGDQQQEEQHKILRSQDERWQNRGGDDERKHESRIQQDQLPSCALYVLRSAYQE